MRAGPQGEKKAVQVCSAFFLSEDKKGKVRKLNSLQIKCLWYNVVNTKEKQGVGSAKRRLVNEINIY